MNELFSEDIVEAESSLETIENLKRRIEGINNFAEDENEILEIASCKGIESCQMIEQSTGVRLGIINGETNRCPLHEYQSKMKINEKYINLHNHPNYTSHSIADLTILLNHEQISEVRVISADRTYSAKYDGKVPITKEELQEVGDELIRELSLDFPFTRESLYKRNLAISEIYDIIFQEELI